MIPRHLDKALCELGQQEIDGSEANPRISEYLETVGQGSSDEIPWCAAFVNWCVPQGTNLASAKSFLNWGYRIDKPRLGCIVILNRGTQPWMGHIGFYMDEVGDYIYLLGGNQSNKVSIRGYNKNRLRGYRWSDELV
jgi:uncharacterized protein (TIGR02594 family)